MGNCKCQFSVPGLSSSCTAVFNCSYCLVAQITVYVHSVYSKIVLEIPTLTIFKSRLKAFLFDLQPFSTNSTADSTSETFMAFIKVMIMMIIIMIMIIIIIIILPSVVKIPRGKSSKS